jgi:hypothetical protein
MSVIPSKSIQLDPMQMMAFVTLKLQVASMLNAANELASIKGTPHEVHAAIAAAAQSLAQFGEKFVSDSQRAIKVVSSIEGAH